MYVEVIGLEKSFAGACVVKNAGFVLERPCIVGLLGSNGAGKSTTMRMMAGYLLPDRGTISIAGHDVVTDRQAAQSHLGYLPEAANGFQSLNVGEFLLFAAQARGLDGQAGERAVVAVAERLHLGDVFGKALGTLSKGWRQRAWLAQALLHNPRVLILDEPTDGLDPHQKAELRKTLRDLARDRAIIMSTHILEEAESLCDDLIVMNAGRIVANASKDELLDENGRLAPAILRLTANEALQQAVAG